MMVRGASGSNSSRGSDRASRIRQARRQIKTDQRDAERLVRLLMIDALHAVRVPTPEARVVRAGLGDVPLAAAVELISSSP